MLCKLTLEAEMLIMDSKLDGEEAHAFFRCLVDTRLLLKSLYAGRADTSVLNRREDKRWCELSGLIKAMQGDLELARNRISVYMSADC